MATERTKFIFESEFRPGNTVQAAQATLQSLGQAIESVGNRSLSLGKINFSQLERDAREAGVSVGKQFDQALSQALSKAYGSATKGLFGPNAEKALGNIGQLQRGLGIPMLAEMTNLEKALNNMRQAQAVLRATTVNSSGKSRYTNTEGQIITVGALEGKDATLRARLGAQEATVKAEKANAALFASLERAALAPLREQIRNEEAIQTEGRRQLRAKREMTESIQKAGAAQIRAKREMDDDIQAARTLRIRARRLMETELSDRARRFAADQTASTGQLTSGPPGEYYEPIGNRDRSAAGIARARLDSAMAQEAIARAKLSEELSREGRSSVSVFAAQQRLRSALDRVAAAQENLAQVTDRSSASIGQQFMDGFRGRGEIPFAEQIGQAFKFSIFYGTAYKMLNAFTQTMQLTLQEGIEFQQAVTELKIATGRAGDEVEAIAAVAGSNAAAAGFAPSQGILTASRSLGLFGATSAQGATADEQRRIADISSRVISRMATGSKFQPEDLQANIAAIAQAFGTGAAGQLRVYDLDAYLARYFGIGPGSTLETVAQSATVGRAAGFNQEQITAMAANLQSRTGQTPSAVAGFMAQIFSRGGEGTLTSIADRYGIDTQQDLAKQIAELAKVYKGAPNAEQLEISAAFGRGKIQNAGVVLLEEWDVIMEAAKKAQEGADGAGDEAFKQRLDNLGGQIALTTGVVKDFASQLGQSGVLDILGAGLVTFREFLEMVNGGLKLWNQLNDQVQVTAIALGALAAASRGAAAAEAVGAGADAADLLGGDGRSRGRRGRLGGLGSLLGGVVRGAGIAGALGYVGGLYNTGSSLTSARLTGEDALGAARGLSGSGSTPEQLRAAASELRSAARSNRDAADWFGNAITGGAAGARGEIAADELERQARYLASVAEQIENRREGGGGSGNSLAFIDDLSSDGLTASFEGMDAAGMGAVEQFNALIDTLNGTAQAAANASAAFTPGEFGLDVANAMYGRSAGTPRPEGWASFMPWLDGGNLFGLDDQAFANIPSVARMVQQGSGSLSDVAGSWRDALGRAITPADIGGAVEDQVAALGITDGQSIVGEVRKRLAAAVAAQLVQQIAAENPSFEEGDIAALEEILIPAISGSVKDSVAVVQAMLDPQKVYTAAEAEAAAAFSVEKARLAVDSRPQADFAGRTSIYQQLVDTLGGVMENTSGSVTTATIEQISAARTMLFEAQFNQLEAERRAAQQSAQSMDEVAAIGQRYLRAQIQAAVASQDVDALARVLQQAGVGAIGVAQETIAAAVRVAMTAQSVQNQLAAAAARMMPMLGGLFGIMNFGANVAPLLQLQTSLGNITSAGENNVYDTGSDVPSVKDQFGGGGAGKGGMSPEERARRLREYRYNLALLRTDQTDPLEMARLDLRFARSDLAAARKKGNKFDIAEQRVAVQNAQTNLEATKFQQRLDDVQTAEQLGKISHAQYIKYLENESKRLNKIKDRTRQQQDQLNQIDLALKEARESAHDQWNFGDINLPKPYQVRRYIEAQANGISMDARRDNLIQQRNVTIQINGADTGKVREIIRQEVGRGARTITPTPRRR